MGIMIMLGLIALSPVLIVCSVYYVIRMAAWLFLLYLCGGGLWVGYFCFTTHQYLSMAVALLVAYVSGILLGKFKPLD